MASETQRGWNNAFRSWRPHHYRPPKLSPQQRDAITRRLADGETVAALALEYGVSRRTIDHYRP
ncbi:helix-turn-helix domain-containing protein [Streptomyces sp. NPDC004069]